MKKQKPNPEMIDGDNPEWTDEMFASAKHGREALEEIFGKENADALIANRVGRPQALNPKTPVSIRISTEVESAYRATGKGWQTLMNKALTEWAKSHGML